jgi:hypothetical protein
MAATGTRSLRVDGLSTTGAVTLSSKALSSYGWHKVTAKVRIPAGQPDAVVTLKAIGSAQSGVVPGSVRVTAAAWAEVTAYVKPTTLYADWYCNGQMTGTQAPYFSGAQLVLDVASCGGTDRPTTVFVDDVVVAINGGAGNPTTTAPPPSSPPPPDCGTSTPPVPPAPCLAKYQVTTAWPGGNLAEVRVKNLLPRTLTSWTVRWTFPDDRTIVSLWGGTWTQNGRDVTVTSYGWSTLPQGATATIGLVVNGGDATAVPATIRMDGNACPALT